MNKALPWILVLAVLASLIIINAMENNERPDRKLANIDYSGVISIDCGESEGYTDKATNVQYQADDTTFVQSGQIGHVSSKYIFTLVPQIMKQLTSLRSFPIGKRNCYTLKPKRGKNNEYLIRAYFAYGNYDSKDKVPTFDLHLGVNNFTTIVLDGADDVLRAEVIHFTTTGTIDLCLVDTNQGEPFISLLELWPLDNSVYQIPSKLLPRALMTRRNLGMSQTDGLFVRYMDDIYGRSWFDSTIDHSSPINTATAIALEKFDDPYKLPSEVLSTAVLADELYHSLDISKSFNTTFEYYVYLHFFDFVERKNNQTRIMNINNNGVDASIQSLTLPYWKPQARVLYVNQGEHINISVIATSDSDLPAMLNSYEIYQVVPQPNSATQQDDIDAIRRIKDVYKIPLISWQGDPCGPTNFKWEGLNCNDGDNPRIISLNLSSSKLLGPINDAFSILTHLETLDLSNNELTGEVPQFFAQLPNLKMLNLSGNKLTGSIPETLKAKLNNSLQLSLDGNPDLCQIGSCKSIKKQSIVPLVASIVASVLVLNNFS